MTRNESLFERALRVIPGGVNSPVRAFRSVERTPVFVSCAEGCRVWDAGGVQYDDYICSWGPMILGHSRPEVTEAIRRALDGGTSYGLPTEREVEMAELACSLVPGLEMVRMVSSGTEAVMSALRLARGFTGRPKIVKFEGCYHGHGDSVLVKAGSGLATAGCPDSAGVTAGAAADTLTCRYNDLENLKEILNVHGNSVAAIIVEPVAANMGVVLPRAGFLEGLRELTRGCGALLIFDEVITGFRLSLSGAAGRFGVVPDLFTFGKIIGGGLPVGAYGGRREIMERVAPSGPVYQAGTLSGNPLAMAAGLASLSILKENPDIYAGLERRGDALRAGLRGIFSQSGLAARVQGIGSLSTIFFTDGPVDNYDDANKSDRGLYSKFFNALLSRGVLTAPSQFEAMFLSAAHGDAEVKRFLDAAGAAAAELARK